MSEATQPTPEDRARQQRETMLRNVRENARAQSSVECLNNYMASCQAHGGVMAEVVAQVRREMGELQASDATTNATPKA